MTVIEQGTIGDFPYKIVEHPRAKHLCGYIGVPPSHPYYRMTYQDNDWNNSVINLDVHGGVTFTEHSSDLTPAYFMYGDNDLTLEMDIWWIGFDCAHAGDLRPGDEEMMKELMGDRFQAIPGDTYKDQDYVYKELEGLASQLSGVLAE